MSNTEDRLKLFELWADNYDASVNEVGTDDFPFAGYDEVLQAIVTEAQVKPGMRILDVGIGTGNLAALFLQAGCTVWGVDFSTNMLKQAAHRLPSAHLVQANLLQPLPSELHIPFDRAVSAYVLHEFDLTTKIHVLNTLAQNCLTPNGRIIVGDISFPDAATRSRAHSRWHAEWDEDEFYWAADEALAALAPIGWEADYNQISSCAGVFVIKPR